MPDSYEELEARRAGRALILPAFRINFDISVLVEGFERLEDESVDQARDALRRELEDALRQTAYGQTAYGIAWEIVDYSFEEVSDEG